MGRTKPLKIGIKRGHGENGRFVIGNEGGPGRPKGSLSLVGMLKSKLEEIPADQKNTYAELLILRLIKLAIQEGDIQAIKDVINRIDGMPRQSIDNLNKNIDINKALDDNKISDITKALDELTGQKEISK